MGINDTGYNSLSSYSQEGGQEIMANKLDLTNGTNDRSCNEHERFGATLLNYPKYARSVRLQKNNAALQNHLAARTAKGGEL